MTKKRIGILTAGGDTPALNATLYGAVEEACRREIEVVGFIRGFSGLLDPRGPHVRLNPLETPIPELDPTLGGTLLGASRTYIDPNDQASLDTVRRNLDALRIRGLICVGGDGTINGMQPIAEHIPCVLAPKTIDNDLGLNYPDEPNEWIREELAEGEPTYRQLPGRREVALDEIINYATPGYATAVYVVAQGVERIRTTAESHRRIAIIEVMGRQSGFIALGSAYGQPDLILLPEIPLDLPAFVDRVKELYALQKHVVLVVGEGILDEKGQPLGAESKESDPAGNIRLSGAAEALKSILSRSIPDEYFKVFRRHEPSESVYFTRKVGHTQRGGRPIRFDRFYAAQLGGQAVSMIAHNECNSVATLQWSESKGFHLASLPANRLRDQWGNIRPRQVHPSFFDAARFQPSKLGRDYLHKIFQNAIGVEDVQFIHDRLFAAGNLSNRYPSVNIDIQKRIEHV